MEKIIMFPSMPITQERLIRLLILERMLVEERVAVMRDLAKGKNVEAGTYTARLGRGGELIVLPFMPRRKNLEVCRARPSLE
jgi:hypothetical protein